jgi:putative SOS response-associated peptidase YedK
MARWGMPGPPQYGGAPVTNIRNVSSPHWRGWLGPRNRCIVPRPHSASTPTRSPARTPIWFALAEDRPLFAFADLSASWRGVRGPKSAPVEGRHDLFGFLTTDANAIVAPIHPKAMPVILTTAAEIDQWLEGETVDALELQRPLPDETLRIVAKGEKQDSTKTPRRSPDFDRMRPAAEFWRAISWSARHNPRRRQLRILARRISRLNSLWSLEGGDEQIEFPSHGRSRPHRGGTRCRLVDQQGLAPDSGAWLFRQLRDLA